VPHINFTNTLACSMVTQEHHPLTSKPCSAGPSGEGQLLRVQGTQRQQCRLSQPSLHCGECHAQQLADVHTDLRGAGRRYSRGGAVHTAAGHWNAHKHGTERAAHCQAAVLSCGACQQAGHGCHRAEYGPCCLI
jgi:hypothetical protein